MLEDLRDYGIVYQRKKASKRYYPTRLATTLTSGNAALASATIKHNTDNTESGVSTDSEAIDQGFVILETNYKVYAYTGKKRVTDVEIPNNTYRTFVYRFTFTNCCFEFIRTVTSSF